MGKKALLFLSVVFLMLNSCKKTELDDDLNFFVGTWEWKHTIKTGDLCDYFPYDTLVTNSPSTDGYTYALKFLEKGKLVTYKNGKKKKSYRLVLDNVSNLSYGTVYYFKLNNRKKCLVSFIHYNSSIGTREFPEGLLGEPDGCQSMHCVFTKTN